MRYIPNSGKIGETMLQEIGFQSYEELFNTQIPQKAQYKDKFKIQNGISEQEIRNLLYGLAKRNFSNPQLNFCGAGIYFHYIPSIVDSLSSRSEFLTSYTPYQPEISQGNLRYIFEFQSYLTSLTQMEVANASMYDGSTSFAEAVLMAKRIHPKRKKVLFSHGIHPQYREVAITTSEQFGIEYLSIPLTPAGTTDDQKLASILSKEPVLAVCVQSPNFFGIVENVEILSQVIQNLEEKPLFVVTVPEAMSLALYEPPGSFGADIVCGEAQSFGNYPGFGGPGVGFFTSRQKHVRNMPGRIVGQTLDGQGKTAFCLTLATREQHIRREKATSNICTNQGWCSLRSTIYLSTMGSEGLKQAAQNCYANAHHAFHSISQIPDIKPIFSGADFFNEFLIEVKDLSSRFQHAVNRGIIPGIPLLRFKTELSKILPNEKIENGLLVAFSEMHTKAEINRWLEAIGGTI